MCIPLSLLINGSIKTLRGNEYTVNNRKIVRPVVFYAVRVVSKERSGLVHPRNSCFSLCAIVPVRLISFYLITIVGGCR
jgi:hypothetical protein